jgi:hypothetical protein
VQHAVTVRERRQAAPRCATCLGAPIPDRRRATREPPAARQKRTRAARPRVLSTGKWSVELRAAERPREAHTRACTHARARTDGLGATSISDRSELIGKSSRPRCDGGRVPLKPKGAKLTCHAGVNPSTLRSAPPHQLSVSAQWRHPWRHPSSCVVLLSSWCLLSGDPCMWCDLLSGDTCVTSLLPLYVGHRPDLYLPCIIYTHIAHAVCACAVRTCFI